MMGEGEDIQLPLTRRLVRRDSSVYGAQRHRAIFDFGPKYGPSFKTRNPCALPRRQSVAILA
jgi:hypothetical protein